MHHFRYSGHDLHCESVDLAAIAKLYGTPTYVYSAATIADNYTRLQRGLAGLDAQICYAMKANSNVAILRHFANLGAAVSSMSLPYSPPKEARVAFSPESRQLVLELELPRLDVVPAAREYRYGIDRICGGAGVSRPGDTGIG